MSKPVKVFVSYSRKDREYKEELLEFLAPMRRQNLIESWNDKDIVPGEQWEDELLERLTTADMAIFLVSPSLLNSEYIHRVEIKNAMKRHKNGELVIVPVIVRSSDFDGSDFKTFQGLPTDLKPISNWEDRDNAWLNVIKGIKRVIQSIQQKTGKKVNSTTPQDPPLSSTSSLVAPPNPSMVIREARQAIMDGKTQKAIDLLSEHAQANNLGSEYNDLIMQSGRLSNLEREKRQGVRSSNEIAIEMNRINSALLSIISNL